MDGEILSPAADELVHRIDLLTTEFKRVQRTSDIPDFAFELEYSYYSRIRSAIVDRKPINSELSFGGGFIRAWDMNGWTKFEELTKLALDVVHQVAKYFDSGGPQFVDPQKGPTLDE